MVREFRVVGEQTGSSPAMPLVCSTTKRKERVRKEGET